MVYFNLVMVNLNGEYDPYDPGAGQLPNQAEWDEIFAICGKQHAQYWNDPAIKQPPLAADATGVFKLAPIEEMLALTVGPGKIIESWFDAYKEQVALLLRRRLAVGFLVTPRRARVRRANKTGLAD